MTVEIRDPGSEYVLNHCTKYLTRAGSPPELGDEDAAAAFRARIAEAWRFPIIGLVREERPDDAPPVNLVTRKGGEHGAAHPGQYLPCVVDDARCTGRHRSLFQLRLLRYRSGDNAAPACDGKPESVRPDCDNCRLGLKNKTPKIASRDRRRKQLLGART